MSDRPSETPSDTPAPGPGPRGERVLVRAGAALAVLAWLAAGALVAAQAAKAIALSPLAFSLTAIWLVNAGRLGFGIGMLRGGDRHIMRVLTRGLPIGDPRLDEVLLPAARRWRTRAPVRRALGYGAAIAWMLAAIYTYQAAAGVYHLPLLVVIFTLVLLLSLGGGATGVLLAGAADVRREAAYDLACEAHAYQRARREQLGAVAARAPRGRDDDDTGAPGGAPSAQEPPGLRVVREDEREGDDAGANPAAQPTIAAALLGPAPRALGLGRIRAALNGTSP